MELRKNVGNLSCRAPPTRKVAKMSATFLVERRSTAVQERRRSTRKVADIFLNSIVCTSKITRTCRDAGLWTALRVTVLDRGPRYGVMHCGW
eukprot:5464000-Prymnesium_polylepis.1